MAKNWIILMVAAATAVPAAPAVPAVPAAPAVAFTPDTCRLEVAAGDKVEMKDSGGVLTLTYDVAVDKYKRIGHQSFRQGTFRLLLKNHVTVAPDQARVLFDAIGISDKASLRPLLQDQNGEFLSYTPHDLWIPRLSTTVPAGKWAKWNSRAFCSNEAGGAAKDIYDAEGGDGNSRPDGTLRFLGFEGRLLSEPPPSGAELKAVAGERRKGTFFLAQVRLGKVQIPDEEPAVFADTILEKKGHYRIGVQLRDEFQGLPYREDALELDFDPADPVSRYQTIPLAIGPVWNSWIDCTVRGPDGVIGISTFRWVKNIPPGGAKPPKVDAGQPPPVGALRINPEAHANGVYQPTEPLTVTVRIFKTAAVPAKMKWTLTAYAYDDVLQNGEANLDFKGAARLDLPVALQCQGRNAFHFNVTLLDAAGQEIEQQEYVLGIAQGTIAASTSRTGILRGRDYVKRSSYFRITYGTDKVYTKEDDQYQNFVTMLDESAQMTNYVTYMIDLAAFEILPGVYDFVLLDRLMDAAADRGAALTIRIAHGEQRVPYRWMPYTLPRNFDGDVIPGHRTYGAFEVADPAFVKTWFKAFEALHARYLKHPAFQGYYLMQPAGEWTFPDAPYEGLFAGYSWAAAERFRGYLRDELKLSLAQLNARWKTAYKDWKDVQPPQPDFSVGMKPDLRPEWVDFSQFKSWLTEWWFPAVSAHIRTFDPDHVIIDYGGKKMNGEPVSGLVGVADYLHNGGNNYLQHEGAMVKAWDEGGLGWITEPHHPHRWAAYGEPGQRGWILDWSVFVMTAQAGAGGENLHVYYWPNPTLSLAAHYGGAFAYDRFEKYKPILRELQGCRLVQAPKTVAVIQDPSTLFLKHRTVFTARLADLRRWFELLTQDSVDYEYYRQENEAGYKLLLLNPLDEVVSADTLDTAVRMANNGAILVMSARTGRYCPGKGDTEYPLLKALGIPVPTGEYVTGVPGPTAKVTGDNPFLAPAAPLQFYTQHDLRRELGDEEIGKNFWTWTYRWIPETDYFGFYRMSGSVGGKTLATFPDGSVAASLHTAGKGQVLVFWGTPDMKPELRKGMMARFAQAAGVVNPRAGNVIPYALETDHKTMKRHYVLLYQEAAGDYVQKMPGTPDGVWFIDDMVSDHKYGLWKGDELRTKGMKVSYTDGDCPLKILRMIPEKQVQAPWVEKYHK